jgi:phosphopantothenoylcysteine synthetase/decarboxylase
MPKEMVSTESVMAWCNLDRQQKRRFKKLQEAFRWRTLWVGFKDGDPRTACDLIVEDDDGDNEHGDDSGQLADYVYDGKGDPDEIAAEYAEEMGTYLKEFGGANEKSK